MSGMAEPDGEASKERTRALGRVSTYTYEGLPSGRVPRPSAGAGLGSRRVEVTTYVYSKEPAIEPVCLGTTYYWELHGQRIAEGPVLPPGWAANLADGRLADEEAGADESGEDKPES